MSFTAYNVKLKRKEKLDNPRLVTRSNKGRTTYLLTAPGSDGTALWRIISKDQAADFKKGLPPRKRHSTSSPKRRTRTRRSSSTRRSTSSRKTRRRSKSKSRSKSRRKRGSASKKKRRSKSRRSKSRRSKSRRSKSRRSKSRRRKTHRKKAASRFRFF